MSQLPFMSSCVDQYVKNRYEVDPAMDAILSVDTTLKETASSTNAASPSPTIKEGYILRMSEDLLSLMSVTTGNSGCVPASRSRTSRRTATGSIT